MICSNIHCLNYDEKATRPCADCASDDKKHLDDKERARREYERKHPKKVRKDEE